MDRPCKHDMDGEGLHCTHPLLYHFHHDYPSIMTATLGHRGKCHGCPCHEPQDEPAKGESLVDLRLKARSAAAVLRDALEHRGLDDVSALVEQFGDTFRSFNRMRADQMNQDCGMAPTGKTGHNKP